jgi:7,8-dihydropterin-6-yl-methyl-4-(beta-D-ribofuranosyl)aminobenzene 5'-phosphate synthase
MCTDESPASRFPAVLHDFEPAVEIALEPVDSVVVTTLMDNVTHMTMPDQGPARRPGRGNAPSRAAALMEDGRVTDALVAEHGFSVLVTVAKAGQEHRFRWNQLPSVTAPDSSQATSAPPGAARSR